MKKIYMYLLDTMADWETGYLLQGLTLQNMLPEQRYQLCTVALSKKPVRTAGGVTIMPDISLDELEENETAALILIGADTWADEEHTKILNLTSRLLQKDVVVAAICGATLGLANIGILNSRSHTSNALFFLKATSPNYSGELYYKNEVAVCDKNLVTASSAGSLLWAKYILEQLNIFSDDTLNAWYNYFSTGDANYFTELMNTFKA